MTRRHFLSTTARTGVGLSTLYFLGPEIFNSRGKEAYPPERHIVYEDGQEYMAFSTARPYQAYMTRQGPAQGVTWAQIDLGSSQAIEVVKLYPAIANGWGFWTDRFPRRFKIEASDDARFATPELIADRSQADFDAGLLRIWQFPGKVRGRYLRLTVNGWAGDRVLLSKIGVLVGGKDIAEGCAVSVDSVYGNPELAEQLTRPARPMGEGIITDNPGNVTDAASWKPPLPALAAPVRGVTLGSGLFQAAMQYNIRYLLETDRLEHQLHPFYERAGKTPPSDPKPQEPQWETYLPDSSAGRFLMGAGNTLRWMEHPELRTRMNALVDGIAACREADGYILAYAPDTVFDCERGAYDRAWLTHGLIEAGRAGNATAFELLRGFYDWFNQWSNLPKLLRGAGQGGQGDIANTRLYFTPAGKSQDIGIVQRYFQEDFWMEQLAARNPDAIWLYPYDRPHAYLITNLEAYLDLYLATGDSRYLQAALGGWELFRDHWQHIGGTIAICEFGEYPPDSRLLHARTGEFCGSVFWVRFNQRFHFLFPDEEKYAGEIEKSIYNIGLANQVEDQGIIYTTRLIGGKDPATRHNTCCEGQGTRLYGSLPEYIYSLAPDGVSINLFEASTLDWSPHGQDLRLKMTTRFPFENGVKLEFAGGNQVSLKVRVRVPGWSMKGMEILVNGKAAAESKPGSYVTLERAWSEGDVISFELPVGIRVSPYRGADPSAGNGFAVEYGPILMAATDPAARFDMDSSQTWESFAGMFKPDPGGPLHFKLGDQGAGYVPYWQIKPGQGFTCFATAVT